MNKGYSDARVTKEARSKDRDVVEQGKRLHKGEAKTFAHQED